MTADSGNDETTVRTMALSLNIRDLAILHAAYMPYIRHGGIFIPTNRTHTLGEEMFMLIALPGESVRLPVAGKVVWITPPGAQGNKAQGIGVQFRDDDTGRRAKDRIEGLLAGYGKTHQTTHTM